MQRRSLSAHGRYRIIAALASLTLPVMPGGCGSAVDLSQLEDAVRRMQDASERLLEQTSWHGEDVAAQTLASRPPASATYKDSEPNDAFGDAVRVPRAADSAVTLEGVIDVDGDVDIFDLGAITRGDRIVLDLIGTGRSLRPCIGLFDADEIAFVVAHDPYHAGEADVFALVDLLVRRDSAHCFVAIAQIESDARLGEYRLDISIDRGRPVPAPRPQTIVLEFGGGTQSTPLFGHTDTAAFDASRIDPRYAGKDEEIIASIVDTVANRFAAFNVFVLTSDQVGPAAEFHYSTVLLGSFDDTLLGASAPVDAFNADPTDQAVVFTERFSPSRLGFTPDPEALGVAIGNVAAHEAGHLLGLRHVTARSAVMAEATNALHLIEEQAFETAPLDPSVFPVGFQNARLQLAETVGLR